MGHLLELCIEVTAYALCWRVGVVHLWMSRLQVLQLMHQEVEVLIADGGLVQYVVTVIMFVKLFTKLYDSLFLVHCLYFFAKVVQIERNTKFIWIFPRCSLLSSKAQRYEKVFNIGTDYTD